VAVILRGAAMTIVADHTLEATGLLRVNVGKRGAPFTTSDVLTAKLMSNGTPSTCRTRSWKGMCKRLLARCAR